MAEFDSVASFYDNQRKIMGRGDEQSIKIIKDILNIYEFVPEKILDIGIGTGYFSSFFLNEYKDSKVVGVDISFKMIEETKNLRKGRVYPIINDMTKLSFKENTFDTVISSLSIHHIKDTSKKKTVKRIYRLLKEDGIFIIWDKFREANKIEKLYHAVWKNHMKVSGVDDKTIIGIEKRRRFDVLIHIERFIKFLKTAGFVEINIPYKELGMSLIIARKR